MRMTADAQREFARLPTFARFGLERFAPVSYEHYAPEEQALQECERLLSNRLSRSDSLLRSSGSAKRI